MNPELDNAIRRHDDVEAQAYRDMYAAAPPKLAQSLGLETREIAGATLLIAAGVPSSMFNRVIGLGNTRPVSESDLDVIGGVYRAAGVMNWWVHVSPGRYGGVLAERLSARGFAPPNRKSWAKVERGCEAPAPVVTDAEVGLARRGEEEMIAEAICAAFDMPAAWSPWFVALMTRAQWRAVAARMNGKVVGGGFLHVQGANGWLGAGGVRPEARRLHAHRALMMLRIQQAIDLGCTQILTETGEAIDDEPNPSLRNMQACGFHTVYSRLNYAAPV